MLQLPNNCRAGKMSVSPTNWRTARANASLKWYIQYRFYDDNTGQVKKVPIKGMNVYTTLKEKQAATKLLMEDEIDLILNQGYNRITKRFSLLPADEVTEYSGLIDALDFAFSKITGQPATIIDLKSCLQYIRKAADSLMITNTPIKDIRRKHLIQLLDRCGEIKKRTTIVISKDGKTRKGVWTANTYNQYRSNLSMLYGKLMKYDIVDNNIVIGIEKKASLKRIRETLTKAQRKQINAHLLANYPTFWRFLQIFFQSGSRIIEMLALKTEDVDIERQRFKVVVKKGQLYREEWRVIRDSVLYLWQQLMAEAGKGCFLFAEDLKPGIKDKPIRREQITKRWRDHVKKPLNITADFYSVKHTNLDETAAILGIDSAAKMAGHTSTVVTMKHYAQGESARQDEELRKLHITFA